jgi:hypothetical protein
VIGNIQLSGNLLVPKSICQHAQNLQFARGKRLELKSVIRMSGSRAAKPLTRLARGQHKQLIRCGHNRGSKL